MNAEYFDINSPSSTSETESPTHIIRMMLSTIIMWSSAVPQALSWFIWLTTAVISNHAESIHHNIQLPGWHLILLRISLGIESATTEKNTCNSNTLLWEIMIVPQGQNHNHVLTALSQYFWRFHVTIYIFFYFKILSQDIVFVQDTRTD